MSNLISSILDSASEIFQWVGEKAHSMTTTPAPKAGTPVTSDEFKGIGSFAEDLLKQYLMNKTMKLGMMWRCNKVCQEDIAKALARPPVSPKK